MSKSLKPVEVSMIADSAYGCGSYQWRATRNAEFCKLETRQYNTVLSKYDNWENVDLAEVGAEDFKVIASLINAVLAVDIDEVI